jgi:hypothetical protein
MSKKERPEEKRFLGGIRRVELALLKLRTSADEHDERRKAATKIYKAIERLKDSARREGIESEELLSRVDALRPQVALAVDQASQNYNAENLRQLAEIEQRIKQRNANQGGFEKELELARGRRP